MFWHETIDTQPIKRPVPTAQKPMKGYRLRTAVNHGHVLQITTQLDIAFRFCRKLLFMHKHFALHKALFCGYFAKI